MNETPGNPHDQQDTSDRVGKVDVFSGHEPDGIAMTGEEDPLAEVDTDGFADIVAEFAATEKRRDS